MLNNEKFTFNDIVYYISKMSKLEEEHFKVFWRNRLVTCKVPVSDPILLNSFSLPGNPSKATEKDPVLTLAMMEKLKKAGKTQSELVENLLRTEMFEIPQIPLSRHKIACNESISFNIQAFISFNEEWNID